MIRIHKSAITSQDDNRNSLWDRLKANPRKPSTISLFAQNQRFIRQDGGKTVTMECVGDLPAIEVDKQSLLNQLCRVRGEWVLLASDSNVLRIEGQSDIRHLPCRPLRH